MMELSYSLEERCRLCLSKNVLMFDIFGDEGLKANIEKIIADLLCINVDKNDELPQVVCYQCIGQLQSYHNFKSQCRKAQNTMKNWNEYIESEYGIKLQNKKDMQNSRSKNHTDSAQETSVDVLTLERKDIILKPDNSSVNVQNRSHASISIDSVYSLENSNNVSNSICVPLIPNEDKTCPNYEDKSLCFEKSAENKNNITSNMTGMNMENTQPLQWRFVKKLFQSDGSERYQCILCKKSYSNKIYLHQHLKAHTDKTPLYCSICNKLFESKHAYAVHCRRQHRETKHYNCDQCQRHFFNKTGLAAHQRSHTDKKPFCCAKCKKSFFFKTALERHLRVHTGEKPYPCDYCARSFIDKKAKLQHHQIHKNEKLHTCSVCKQTFKQVSALKTHARVHSENGLFICSICDLCFKTKGNLVIHTSTNHSDILHSALTLMDKYGEKL